jgi:hypothetical protein
LNQQADCRLLLDCLHAGNGAGAAAAMTRRPVSEWDELLRQSIRHGVALNLYRRLKTMDPALPVPGSVEQRLRGIYLHNASRNIRFYHESGKTLELLRNAGISVILLKGAHLAEAVYGNIALRAMADVDIMVKKDDLHQTVTLLFQNGFRVIDEKQKGCLGWRTGTHYGIPPNAKHFLDLAHPAWPGSLDVHCSITAESHRFNIDVKGIWARAISFKFGAVEALALSPEDLLLYQCLHASLHHMSESDLLPLCDIAEIIMHYKVEMGWERVQSRAREWGAGRCVYLPLQLAREMLGAEVPECVLMALQPGDPNRELTAWARERILSDPGIPRSHHPNQFRFLKTRRFRILIAAFLMSIFPSPRAMAVLYNISPGSIRIFLYYPVRLKDMFLRYGRTFWLFLLHNKQMISIVESESEDIALAEWLTSEE